MPKRTEASSAEVVAYIADYLDKHGYPPTRREVAEHFNVWPSTGQLLLERAGEDGYLENTPGITRGIRITEAGMKALTETL